MHITIQVGIYTVLLCTGTVLNKEKPDAMGGRTSTRNPWQLQQNTETKAPKDEQHRPPGQQEPTVLYQIRGSYWLAVYAARPPAGQ